MRPGELPHEAMVEPVIVSADYDDSVYTWDDLANEHFGESPDVEEPYATIPASEIFLNAVQESAGEAAKVDNRFVFDTKIGQIPDASKALVLSRQHNIDAALALIDQSFHNDSYVNEMVRKTNEQADKSSAALPGSSAPDEFMRRSGRSDRVHQPLIQL